MKELSLVVMAAGIGSRYGGLKQIEPVGPSGEILLEYSLYDAWQAGFDKVIFIIKPEMEEALRRRMGEKLQGRLKSVYAFQELNQLPPGFKIPENRTKPWGTGHAVLAARDFISGPFAVINGDDYYGRQSFAILADFLRSPEILSSRTLAMVGYPVENTLSDHGPVARGVCRVDENELLREIVERPKVQSFSGKIKYSRDGNQWHDLPAGSLVSMNLWGFPLSFMEELQKRFPQFLSAMKDPVKEEYFLPAVVDELIKEGLARVRVLSTRDRWFGITYRQDREQVVKAIAELVAAGRYPENLWAT